MGPEVIGTLLAFLADHADLVAALVEAVETGASKESIQKAIKAAQVEASDVVMREELGG